MDRFEIKDDEIFPLPPVNYKQSYATQGALYNGSHFTGSQSSKGSQYKVEVCGVLWFQNSLSLLSLFFV